MYFDSVEQNLGALKTFFGHEVEPEERSVADDGARFWGVAELRADFWFWVEGFPQGTNGPQQHWLSTSVEEAIQLACPTRTRGARMTAFAPEVAGRKGESVFGLVAELLASRGYERVVIRFCDGSTVLLADVRGAERASENMLLECVYSADAGAFAGPRQPLPPVTSRHESATLISATRTPFVVRRNEGEG